MFEDIVANDVLNAISKIDKNNTLRNTEYGLWFHGNTYSPAGVISKIFELREDPINRRSFTTDVAQKRLLELGFPIVEIGNEFFSKKELKSFEKIIARKTYDENSPVDKNIGLFLNQVIWEKTRIWAERLQDEYGWHIGGKKSWNKQNGSVGQAYKQYTWWRIYPDKDTNSLFFYTVGMHSDGQLLYKIDIKRDEPFFSEVPAKIEQFESLRSQFGIGWQKIEQENISELDWDELIEKTNSFFENHLLDFYKIKNEFQPDKRLMRLTWNDNNWEFPSGHFHNISKQGDSDVAYEKQYGYGHEEWLFNARYRLDDYQFGYIRGVDGLGSEVYFLKEILLYTIKESDKQRYIIGKISNIQILDEDDIADFKPVYDQYKNDMLSELRSVGADWKHFKKEGLFPNIKFKWTDFEQYNEPIKSEYLKSSKFNRFQPIKLTAEIEENLKHELSIINRFKFNSGKSDSVGNYIKQTKKSSVIVNKVHVTIVDELYKYLNQKGDYLFNQLSAETSEIGGAIPDLVIEEEDGYTIFEVKSSATALKNIRQALGQIFEYAFLDNSLIIKRLVMVGPAPLHVTEKRYLNTLKSLIKVPLEYWEFDSKNSKFIK